MKSNVSCKMKPTETIFIKKLSFIVSMYDIYFLNTNNLYLLKKRKKNTENFTQRSLVSLCHIIEIHKT